MSSTTRAGRGRAASAAIARDSASRTRRCARRICCRPSTPRSDAAPRTRALRPLLPPFPNHRDFGSSGSRACQRAAPVAPCSSGAYIASTVAGSWPNPPAARTRAIIDLLGYTVTLPLMLWLTYALFQHLEAGYLRNEHSGQSSLNLPVWPFRVVFLVAFTLLALQIFAEVIKTMRRLKGGSN